MPKKVFELAKEIGVGAVDLVEQLKSHGFDVKNHMVSLSDEDVEKAMAALAPKEETKAKKKVVKKKAAKKVAKKVVVKKATGTDTKEAITPEAESAKIETKPKTVKKNIVTRKKADIIEAKEAREKEKENEIYEGDKPQGLQVVSRPAAKVEVSAKAEQEPAETKQEVYKEKMHAFTPIFTPPEEEKKKTETTTTSAAPKRQFSNAPAAPASDSKKRMGDLASIVSAKGKTKDITQVRADEALKLATVVTGRQIYTPMKRKKIFSGSTKATEITEVKGSKRVVQMFNVTTALELADKLSEKFISFQNKALEMNLLLKKDDDIGIELASELAALYDYRVENRAFDEAAALGQNEKEDKSKFPVRNSIITIMGHVDHGKTTLLDHLRKTKVTEGEAGGITQHIGAYSVDVGGSRLTFLDTPGHAAFGNMRQRGADVTDIVVLVVAADDGVMPQTKESIRYAQKAGSPIIVAINKMDKDGANPERIKQEMTEFELVPEDWGGDTMYVPISALNGDGTDDLLEAIKLQAEMMDLREDPKGNAEGMIIESKIESGRGAVATCLVQKGTLKKGDAIVCGENYGRARSLMDTAGKNVASAGPSVPVQVLGFNTVPSPGDMLNVVKNEREAKKIVENRIADRRKLENVDKPQVNSLEDFFAQAPEDMTEKKILNLVIRTDVQGSFEAIRDAVEVLGNDEVGVTVLAGGVGAITDNDVQMANNSNGFLIGFNMRPVTSARKMAENLGIEVRTYSIIYELINEITLALEGMLEPEKIEKYIGRAEVREIFTIPKVGTIAGTAVIDGKIERGCNIRLLREGKIIHDGKLSTLKRFKDEVKEVANGYECGMALEGFNDIKSNDLIEAYLLEEKKRKLEENTNF